ncbi:hypothetical protein CEXT_225511 [Caerostris extrusa]|uniref:Uncharacterized protein n=1 Tax=Caerostris extrusa TaxID=172846 RepID=A0AAV4PPF3_CAEEX|nr:hypothetical protein CEXT_225511 [Caerostris extrusa]
MNGDGLAKRMRKQICISTKWIVQEFARTQFPLQGYLKLQRIKMHTAGWGGGKTLEYFGGVLRFSNKGIGLSILKGIHEDPIPAAGTLDGTGIDRAQPVTGGAGGEIREGLGWKNQHRSIALNMNGDGLGERMRKQICISTKWIVQGIR